MCLPFTQGDIFTYLTMDQRGEYHSLLTNEPTVENEDSNMIFSHMYDHDFSYSLEFKRAGRKTESLHKTI